MNRIDATFRSLLRQRKKAFIAFLTFADPTVAATEKMAAEFEKRGVDFLELGFPFSDPVADGPIIQRASRRALANRLNLQVLFRTVRRLRQKGLSIPIVLLSYYNPIFRFGEASFAREAKRSGLDGVIVPDLPLEEADGLVRLGRRYDFPFIFLVTPTSARQRRKSILRKARGFLYYVSVTGTTGVRKKLPPELSRDVRSLRKMGRLPVCIGFGVSTPEMARRLSRVADGVIVGSALIQQLERLRQRKSSWVKGMGDFVERFTAETHR